MMLMRIPVLVLVVKMMKLMMEQVEVEEMMMKISGIPLHWINEYDKESGTTKVTSIMMLVIAHDFHS